MSMHMLPAMYNTNGNSKKRRKTKKQSKTREDMLRRLYREEVSMRKRCKLPVPTFEEYVAKANGSTEPKPNKARKAPRKPLPARDVEVREVVPTSDRIVGPTSKKADKEYTGDKLVGIAMMHKSNLVPVFDKKSAEDISKMRR